MNIVIVSAFRNCESRVSHYFDQVRSFQHHAGIRNPVRVIAVEGDSTDKTESEIIRQSLLDDSLSVQFVKYNHGQRPFTSTEDPDRLSALTGVMKTGMSAVDIDRDHIVLYVESDLIWNPHQVGSIIDIVSRGDGGFDIVAPLVFAGDKFYDIWAFRKDGKRFSPFFPYHKDLNSHGLTEVDSVGSCLVFRASLAGKVVSIGEEGLVSWCNGARQMGYRIGVSSDFRVDHP